MLNNQDRFYTVREASKILKTSEQSLRRLIRLGRIKAFRLSIGKKASFRINYIELEKIQSVGYSDILMNLDEIIKENKIEVI